MQILHHPLLSPAPGTQRELVSLHYGRTGGQKAYIQASLHGDELPGMLVAHHLRQQLDALEAAGQVSGEIVLVPMANPIGLSQFLLHAHLGRFELISGENFNRHYPDQIEAVARAVEPQLGANAAANVAVLRRALKAAVQAAPVDTELQSQRRTLMALSCDADIVLDLHCDNEARVHVYAGTPLAEAVAPLARLLGADALLLSKQAGGEPFDEACSRLWWELQEAFPDVPVPAACMAATLELRGEMDVGYKLARQDAEAILAYLAMEGVIDAAPAELPPARCAPTPLEGVEPLLAPHAGILVYTRELGERVDAGTAVADIIDPVSGATTQVRCAAPGVFFARSAHRYVLRGMNVGKVAGRAAYRSGDLLSL